LLEVPSVLTTRGPPQSPAAPGPSPYSGPSLLPTPSGSGISLLLVVGIDHVLIFTMVTV
jgi:hypothetical protein